MDYQTLINIGGATVIAAMGWFAREMWSAVKEMRQAHSNFREEVAKGYVSKDDFKDAMREVRDLLVSIDNKLDRKADK